MDPVSVIIVAAIAVFTSLTAPLLLAWRTERMHRRDRLDDWARQDRLAAGAARAARAAAAATAAVTNEKLDVIHGLVNGNLTAAMQAELDALRVSAAMMHEVMALRQAAGQEPSADAAAALAATEAKIASLTAALAERKIVEQQQEGSHGPA
jgi:hypothetical protein